MTGQKRETSDMGSAMTPMKRVRSIGGRRLWLALYKHPYGPCWHFSSKWGGPGRDRGVGFQVRLFGLLFEAIVYPRRRAV